jgi:hypothetical protein
MELDVPKQERAKKEWTTPHLTVHGLLAEITHGSIPPKEFGAGDGATWDNQQVRWGS